MSSVRRALIAAPVTGSTPVNWKGGAVLMFHATPPLVGSVTENITRTL